MSLRRTGRASVDAVIGRDVWHRPRLAAGSQLGLTSHGSLRVFPTLIWRIYK
jgi:hypothetical protein